MPWTTKYERISQSRKAWTRDFTKRLVTFNKSDSMEKKGGKIYGKIEPKPKEFRSEIEIIFSVKSKLSTSVKFVTWHLGLALIIRLWTWSILNNIIVVYLSRQPNKQVTSWFPVRSSTCTRLTIFSNVVRSDLPINLSRLSQFSLM